MAKLIPLHGKYGAGKFAIVDDEDVEIVSSYKWRCMKKGYVIASTSTNGKHGTLYMHRLVMGHPDSFIDHVHGDKLDCRKEELRASTNQQNTWNNRSSFGKYGLRGVQPFGYGLWTAKLRSDGKTKHLGCFEFLAEAIARYNEEVVLLRGEFAVTNELSPERIAEIEREVKSEAEQQRKERVLGKSNTSGLRGVRQIGIALWKSYIKKDYKQIHLGNYKTKEEAALKYNEAAIKYFGDKAKLNPL